MVFDPSLYTEFRYTGVDFSAADFSFSFRYELVSPDDTQEFTERIAFTPVRAEHEVDWPRVRSLAVMLGAVLGISYYKAAAPSRLCGGRGGYDTGGNGVSSLRSPRGFG